MSAQGSGSENGPTTSPVRTDGEASRTTVRPGELSSLLADLAREPPRAGWERPLSPGETVGRFEIVREVGRGGFGVVYEARDRELARSVALKTLRPGSSGEVRDARALAEAEAAARLAHPNIVHLYDLGRTGRGAYLILELLRGETLAARLGRGRLPLRSAVRLAAEISRGVAHAHTQGVVHRDLKPGNVMLCDDGQVKVLDFGLAHVFGHTAAAGGTPAYMAPEQAKGQQGDERVDVYALGLVVAELLIGSRPLQGRAPGLARGERPPELPGAPAPLAKLVARMLARDPADRPPSAVQVHAQLEAVQKALEPRRALRAAAAVGIAALLGAGLFAASWQRPLPPGRLLTAIADTDNQTGDRDLDAVSELLRPGLEPSRRLSLMPRSRLVNATRASGGSLPALFLEPAAHAAAVREQVQLLLVPEVRSAGTGYQLSVGSRDLARGTARFDVRESAPSKAEVPRAVDGLVRRLRESLQEEPGGAPHVAVADLVPAAPEPVRRWANGQRRASEGRFSEAAAEYAAAIRLEPGFLLPRVGVAESFLLSRPPGPDLRGPFLPDEGRATLDLLGKSLRRLPPSDAAWLGAFTKSAVWTEELVALDAVAEAWPEDPRAPLRAAAILLRERADQGAARPHVEKALALAPLAPQRAIELLLHLDRLDEALARARRWAEDSQDSLPLYWLSEVHRQRGELEPALAAARRAAALPAPEVSARVFQDAGEPDEAERLAGGALARAGSWLATRGRMRDALAAVRLPAAPRLLDRIAYHAARAHLLVGSGDVEAVLQEMAGMLRAGNSVFACEAWGLALVGDPDRDRAKMAATYVVADQRQICTGMTLAILKWKQEGKREAARVALAKYHLAIADEYRGEILVEEGRDREAVELLRAYRLRRGMNDLEESFDWWSYPRSLVLEAAALERLGERAAARGLLDRFLRLWDRADPELPLLAQAKALRARLEDGRGK